MKLSVSNVVCVLDALIKDRVNRATGTDVNIKVEHNIDRYGQLQFKLLLGTLPVSTVVIEPKDTSESDLVVEEIDRKIKQAVAAARARFEGQR